MEVARNFVFTSEITSADATGNPVEPSEAYHEAAVRAAVNQAVSAGHRLASVLNANLK
jgi:hypothetical protein